MLFSRPIVDLIYDGNILDTPSRAREDQAKGTLLEILAEIAGRTCYDSFGSGRSSAGFHEHILEVGHTSIYEHCNLCFQILKPIMNLPGTLWHDGVATTNLRTCLEIEKHTYDPVIISTFKCAGHGVAPRIVGYPDKGVPIQYMSALSFEERWYTFRIRCSRLCSHELVRHKWRTAVSQRSTRYVDESESSFVLHPLLEPGELDSDFYLQARALYQATYQRLVDQGVSHKQARGAARCYLPGNLETEVIFSASLAQWDRMIQQRKSPHADGEINHIFTDINNALARYRYILGR